MHAVIYQVKINAAATAFKPLYVKTGVIAMQSKIDWLELALAPLARAQADEVHVDSHIEQFFHAITQQARGARAEREAMPGEVAAAKISPADRPLVQEATDAVTLWSTGDFSAAEQAFQTLAHVVDQATPQRNCHVAIGVHALTWQAACATREGRLEPATKLLDEAERRLGTQPWPNCRGWLHAERGRLCFWRDRVSESLKEYARAIESFNSAKNRFALANLSEGEARVHIHRGQFSQALQLLFQSDIWRSEADLLGKVKRRYHAGRIFRYQERWQDAVEQLTDALELVLAIDNRRWEAHVRDVLGDVYLLLNDTDAAGRQFKAVVFHGDDPIVAARYRYRMAKLALAEVNLELTGKRRIRRLEEIIRDCDALVAGDSKQLLPEKAQRLKGAALAALGQFEAAAACLENAARGFSVHGSNWYMSDCLQQAGNFRSSAQQLDRAAGNFLVAVKISVGETQRNSVLADLRRNFREADGKQVCELVAELFEQRERIQEDRDHWQMAYASFQEQIDGLAAQISLLGGLRHIPIAGRNLDEMLKEEALPDRLRSRLQDVRQEIEQGCERLEPVAELLRAAVKAGAPRAEPWCWCDMSQVRQALPAEIGWANEEESFHLWGLYAPRSFLGAALAPLVEFATQRREFLSATAKLDFERGVLTIDVLLDGQQLPPDCTLFGTFPLHAELKNWGLDAGSWSRLYAAARLVNAIGGDVSWPRNLAGSHSDVPECVRRFQIELPISAKLA